MLFGGDGHILILKPTTNVITFPYIYAIKKNKREKKESEQARGDFYFNGALRPTNAIRLQSINLTNRENQELMR